MTQVNFFPHCNIFRSPAPSTRLLPTASHRMDKFRLTHPLHSSHHPSSLDWTRSSRWVVKTFQRSSLSFCLCQETTSDGRNVQTTAVLYGNRLIKDQVCSGRITLNKIIWHSCSETPDWLHPGRGGDQGVLHWRPDHDSDPHHAQEAQDQVSQGL